MRIYGHSKSESGARPQCEKMTKEAPIKCPSNQIISYKAPSLHTFHGFKQCFQPALFQTGPTGSHLSHFMAFIKDRSPAVRFGRTTTSRLFSSLNHCSSFFVSKWIWVYSLLNSPPSDQTQSASNGGDQKTHRLLLVFPLKSFIRGPVQDWTTPSPISCNSFSILLFI